MKSVKINEQEVPGLVADAMQTVRNWAGQVFAKAAEIKGVEITITHKGVGVEIVTKSTTDAERRQDLLANKELADLALDAAVDALAAARAELDALPKNSPKGVRQVAETKVAELNEFLTAATDAQADAASALEGLED